jgi:hypothetical protein
MHSGFPDKDPYRANVKSQESKLEINCCLNFCPYYIKMLIISA